MDYTQAQLEKLAVAIILMPEKEKILMIAMLIKSLPKNNS